MQWMELQVIAKKRRTEGGNRGGRVVNRSDGRQVGEGPSVFILVFVSSYFSFISYVNYAFQLMDEKILKK
jgi:hypothetical protein